MVLGPIPVPLERLESGQLRVRGTRIPLEVIVGYYREGASVEEMLERLPTLKAEDLHSVLAHYLTNKAEVDAYVREHERSGEALMAQVQGEFPPRLNKAELLARRGAKGK